MKKWIAGATLAGVAATGVYGADRVQNPYKDMGDHYKLEIASDIPQGERVEIHKDKAQMDLVFWNDEQTISIIPQIPTSQLGATERPFTTAANRPLLSDRMEYKSGDVVAFIETKSANEFDIDFTLQSKPDTNVFTYKIEGADDFSFYYQPPLTQQEIDEGAFRPDNVIGSYAVYHRTKANHRIGSTNYATGKAFHIYRPKAIDANGAEVWAELNYENGVLSVTVSQKFLDEAVYPVRVDPTFGLQTIGASSSSNWPSNSSMRVTTAPFSLTEEGSVTKLTNYTAKNTSDVVVQTVIYDDNSTAPNNREALSDEVTLTSTTKAWVDFTISSPPTLSSGTYWLGTGTSNASVGAAGQFDSGGFWRQNTAEFVDPFGSPSGSGNAIYSIYATYTASGGAAPEEDKTTFQLITKNR